ENLRCESVGQTKRDRIVNFEISGSRPKQNRIAAGLGWRHDLGIEAPDDRRVGVIRANLMVKARSGIHARKIRVTIARAPHFPVQRRWNSRGTNGEAPAFMRRTYLMNLTQVLAKAELHERCHTSDRRRNREQRYSEFYLAARQHRQGE